MPSSSSTGFYKADYLNDGNGGKGDKSVRFTPMLTEERPYTVYMRWPTGGGGRADNTPVLITHAAGVESLQVNQQIDGGTWNKLGTFIFRPGSESSVLVSNAGTHGAVVADAVVFAPNLDLRSLSRTFEETFDGELRVSNFGTYKKRKSKWFANTPYSMQGYGEARFGGMGDPPFSRAGGVLSVRASQGKDGWESGMLASARPDGSGFLQRYGYFEARMKFPGGLGTWPSFWLLSAGSIATPKRKYAELDVVEFYGNQLSNVHMTSHVWNADGSRGKGGSYQVSAPGDLTADFHTYAVLVRPDTTTWLVDDVPHFQIPTLPEAKEPLYMMVCFALGGGYPTMGVPDPSFLEVDFVRAYALPSSSTE